MERPVLFSEGDIDQTARTAEDNSDHVIRDSLETNPDMYKTVLVGDAGQAMQYLKRGTRLSISVNMENFSVYIGSDHLSMQEKGGINPNKLCAGYVRFDGAQDKVFIEDLYDWREKKENQLGIKSAIAEAVHRDLF